MKFRFKFKLNISLSIRKKMYLVFSIVILQMIVLTYNGISSIDSVNSKAQKINDIWLKGMNYAHSMKEEVRNFRLLEYEFAFSSNPSDMRDIRDDDMVESKKNMKKYIDGYIKVLGKNGDKVLTDGVKDGWSQYLDGDKELVSMNKENEDDSSMAQYMDSSMSSVFDNFIDAVNKLIDYSTENSNADLKGSKRIYHNSVLILIFNILFAIAFTCVTLFLLSASINKSITNLLGVSKKVAGGILSEEASIKSRDEFKDLGDNFNKMINNLRSLISKIIASSQNVAAASEELTANAEQNSRTTDQIAHSAQEMANGAVDQANMVHVVSEVTNELVERMDEATKNAEAVSKLSIESAKLADEGNEQIQNAVRQMETINQVVTDSANTVNELGQRASKIGNIVDLIQSIAEQTNLLSLNAAIEAARAGENGKGFAVVAEEIRKLAGQSADATRSIIGIVSQIQAETTKAVQSMNNGTAAVSEGMEIVSYTGKTFEGILEAVERVKLQVQEISNSMSIMTDESSKVKESVQGILDISNNTSASTQTVASSAQEQSASMEEITSSANTLSSMAEELISEVGKFKL